MPDTLTFSLGQLVRVCLNDPALRAELAAALEQAPLPVRTPWAHVAEGKRVFAAIIVNQRDRAPGEEGFIGRDHVGWVTCRFSEILQAEHDASTLSADMLAERLGVPVPK